METEEAIMKARQEATLWFSEAGMKAEDQRRLVRGIDNHAIDVSPPPGTRPGQRPEDTTFYKLSKLAPG